jgi:rhodanese-related sulfurtransferase
MDSDGDGFTNDEEFSAATRPGDATSHPVTFLIITATAGEHGSISPSGEVPVDSGTSQSFTITPDEGYHIVDVLVDGSSVGPVSSRTFTNVTSDHTISVTFAVNTYTITVGVGEHGSMSPSGEVPVEHGASQEFTITPDEGYHIEGVMVDGSSVVADVTDGQYAFADVTSDHTISATFAANIYTIAASAGTHGSISPSGEVPVDHGANQEFIITPDEGYHIEDVLVDGNPVPQVIENIAPQDAFALIQENEGNPNFVILDVRTPEEFSEEHIENAINIDFFSETFRKDVDKLSKMKTYVIYCRSGTRSGQALDIMAELNFAEVHNIPDGIVGWNAAGLPTTTDVTDIQVDMAGHYTFVNVTSDHTISATFAVNTYIIMATAGENGSISPSGEVIVDHGASQGFTITSDSDYIVADVLVDGISVGAKAEHIFENVTADRTIEATFAAIAVPVPNISVSPASHDFGQVGIGSSSDPLVLVISNAGNADLNVSDMALSDTTDYLLDVSGGPSPCGTTAPGIAAGASCTAVVTFSPSSTGDKIATLTIGSDDPDIPSVEISLDGMGAGIKGDVNNDGEVRSSDAILTLRIAVGLLEPTEYQKWAADVREDGKIGSDDAILILRTAAGLALLETAGLPQ